LTGVVFVEGGTGGRAWLQEPTLTQNQVVPLRPGDSLGPYKLTKILEDRVELEGPTGKLVVLLAGSGAPAAAAPARGPAKPQMGARTDLPGPNTSGDIPFPPRPTGPMPNNPNSPPKFDFSKGLGNLLGGQGGQGLDAGGQRKK
jgi:hypothetical protein